MINRVGSRPPTESRLLTERGLMSALSSVAVFCGSRPGNNPIHTETAVRLGETLARRGITLVYGGASVGLMGSVADAALAAGGTVHGFITTALLDLERGHRSLTSLDVVPSMHERKAAMEGAARGFITLPGGFGTMDEVFEIITWAQLGMHHKPIGFLDGTGRYYSQLFAFIDEMIASGFAEPAHREMLMIETDPGRLLDRMAERAALI